MADIDEISEKYVEDNQTRKILDILKECKNLDEAIEKVKAMLNNK